MGIVTAIAAVAGAAYSVYSGEQAAAQQKKALQQQQQAQKEAKQEAQQQQRQSEMAVNAANRKQPDVSGIMDQAGQGVNAGVSGTMLTGPTGVNPNQLALGKNTLLGS